MEHVKKLVACLLVAMFASGLLMGGDINPGTTFTSGQRVYHTDLNNLVGSATINATFVSGQVATSTTQGSDLLLIYSQAASGLRRATLDTVFKEQITDQSGIYSNGLSSADFLLGYDTSGAGLAKVQVGSIFEAPGLIGDRTNWITPDLFNAFVLMYDTNTQTWGKCNRSNLLYNAAGALFPTNLAAAGTLTNQDLLTLSQVSNGTNYVNKKLTLAALITNAPATTSIAITDKILLYSTPSNAVVSTTVSWLAGGMFRSAVSDAVPVAAGKLIDVEHGLGGTPQQVRAVFVCTNADGIFPVGAEVNAADVVFVKTGSPNTYSPSTSVMASSTNLVVTLLTNNFLQTVTNTADYGSLTVSKWRVKVYATRFMQ